MCLEIIEKLAARGLKKTPQRRMLLKVLSQSDRHLSAEEVVARIKVQQPGISVATIYRNLNKMVEMELVSKLDLHDGPARYEIYKGHHHHLVCLGCGVALKIGICPLQGHIKKIIEEYGFRVNDHHFEVTGHCQKCQQEAKTDTRLPAI